MSDSQSPAPAPDAKIPNTDKSLLLPGQPRINKKIIKALMAAFAGVFMIAVILAYSPKTPQAAKDSSVDEAGNIVIRRPPGLALTADDYLPPKEPEVLPPPSPPPQAAAPGYGTYDRRPQVEIRESQPQIFSPPGARSSEAQNGMQRRRGIFYEALPVALTQIDTGQPRQAAGASQGASAGQGVNTAVFESAYASDYQKQNMNSIKENFLRNAQALDFNSYLPTMYMPPIDPYHEIKAGTFIPITLITAINSDLPGPIEAQVIENVYDTYSGRNVLIPRGTRAHGEYSSSVAFGQNRVLIAWQRLTLPDGISVNLQGMQGVDIRGMAGLADMVDYHIDELLAAVGIATVFDLGKAATVAAMSTVEALQGINQILSAQGSASESTNSAISQIVVSYANKLMNQQPTITIREGNRGNIIVSKDIILPAYGVR